MTNGEFAPPPAPPAPGAAASDKSKVAAGILGILLGALGIHEFYLGYSKEGLIMPMVSVLTMGMAAGIVSIIGLIEGADSDTERNTSVPRGWGELGHNRFPTPAKK